jgi:uroporphyrinogen-III decarboxylase
MTPENQAKFDAKWKRIRDAVALKEPDMVPITPSPAIYPFLHAGYTMTEVIYDETMEKASNAMFKYLNDFDPDNGTTLGNYVAEGRLMELQSPTNMAWSGMPGNPIGDNSIQQYIEFPILLDDEFDEYFNDYVTWRVHKELPRNSNLLKPLENFHLGFGTVGLANAVSRPEMKEMIKTLWEIADGYKVLNAKKAAFNKQMEEMGYPIIRAAMGAGVPFDGYSDFLRGTLLSLADLYTNPDEVRRYIDSTFEQTIAGIKASKGRDDGKLVFMALHKGMDGFMSDEHYREYYWSHLQKIIEAIIEADKIPYIFTEGKYNSRLDCLTEVPVGKVFYHFEEVDMALAESKLGKIACIGGGFSPYLLNYGTKEQVVDECKRLLDICAPGGGFIFETAYGMDYAKDENVEAMFETVRTYGKY